MENKIAAEQHGESNTQLYHVHENMKARTIGRLKNKINCYVGIGMCKEWESYLVFSKWARANGYIPNKGLSIDRIDSSKGYSPENCRFIPLVENKRRAIIRANQDRRNTIKISEDQASELCEAYANGNYTQKEIAAAYNVHVTTIERILRKARS